MIITKSFGAVHFLSDDGERIYDIIVKDGIDEDCQNGILEFVTQEDLPLITDDREIYEKLKGRTTVKMKHTHPAFRVFRAHKVDTMIEVLPEINTEEEYFTAVRKIAFERTRSAIKDAAEGRDVILSHSVTAVEDLSKFLNQVYNRLVELYNIHFPELVLHISNPSTYAKIVLECPTRDNLTEEKLVELGLNEKNAKKVIELANSSLGADLKEEDLANATDYAELYLKIAEKKTKIERWIDLVMHDIAPNLTAVCGSSVGAKLISKVGSLEALAKKASSKIQTLGAEKALYSAIKSGGNTPKHGIIFQIPEIGISPFWIRGRIARAFASKIAIAARLDVYHGEFLGEKYREELNSYVEELKRRFPNAPPQKIKRRKGKQKRRPNHGKGKKKQWRGKKGGRKDD